jgi:hypothetical protein
MFATGFTHLISHIITQSSSVDLHPVPQFPSLRLHLLQGRGRTKEPRSPNGIPNQGMVMNLSKLSTLEKQVGYHT